ncbi:DUF2971 domain-containing protein [Thalassotalea sp. SU-HH00458]|uniref:DUF2971 domain-containing protein n=1 Tax=Thalassotalea sp. SU-HH00458 TaxID=3127657 RepID=UPI0031092939
MSKENCIGFDESKSLENKKLYRVFSIERLLELFTKKELTLVKPSAWDDPFENYILNATAVNENGTTFTFDVREHIYGQCWSETRESDAMWRIYSPNITGVKIRTTIGKLNDSFKLNYEINPQQIFIGKVAYQSQKDLILRAENRIEMQKQLVSNKTVGFAKTLLFKRKEFSHENEVRIICIYEKSSQGEPLYSVKIDPYKLIDQVVFDPRIDQELFKVYQAHLKKIGFEGSVIRSTLYELPQLKVNI